MPFPQNVKEDVFVACKRCCTLCHKFCGTKIEVHHIKQEADGGENTFENAIALCFDCHADMRSYDTHHPKGNKYSENELKRLRDEWYKVVKMQTIPQNTKSNDIVVFNKLLELLPVGGSVFFVSHYNFAGFSFPLKSLDKLIDFSSYCERNNAFVFFDSDLEKLRKKLVNIIDKFINCTSMNTFLLPGNGPLSSVPQEWEFTQPERFKHVVNKIHKLSKSISKIHSELINLAVKKLGINPPL